MSHPNQAVPSQSLPCWSRGRGTLRYEFGGVLDFEKAITNLMPRDIKRCLNKAINVRKGGYRLQRVHHWLTSCGRAVDVAP
jgi:hypothetical protein